MIPLRSAALYTAGLLVAFAAGWFLKPAPAPEHAGHSADGASRRIAPPASLAGRPVGTAGETWLDAAAADAAAVRGAARPGEANPVLLEKLGAVLVMTDPAERLARWQALMPLMRMEDAGAIRAMLRKRLSEGNTFTWEATTFWQRCGRMDPAVALTWSMEEGGGSTPDVLGGWACRDPAAAAAWLRANTDRIGVGLITATSGLVGGLCAQSPEAAVELLLANGDEPLFRSSLGMATNIIVDRRGLTAALRWFGELAESGAPAAFKTANLERLLSYGDARDEVMSASRRKELAETVTRYASEPWFSRYAASDLGRYMGELDPVEGAAVMERFRDAETKKYFMEPFLGRWMATDAASLSSWLERKRASPAFDTMASSLAKHLSEEDPQAARGWAAQISDPARREAMEKELSGDPETASDDASAGQ